MDLTRFAALLFFIGTVVVSVGAAMVYLPAGVIAFGSACVVASVWALREE